MTSRGGIDDGIREVPELKSLKEQFGGWACGVSWRAARVGARSANVRQRTRAVPRVLTKASLSAVLSWVCSFVAAIAAATVAAVVVKTLLDPFTYCYIIPTLRLRAWNWIGLDFALWRWTCLCQESNYRRGMS